MVKVNVYKLPPPPSHPSFGDVSKVEPSDVQRGVGMKGKDGGRED